MTLRPAVFFPLWLLLWESMRKFKDRTEREWTLDINVWAIRRVRKLIDVDLLKIVDRGADGSTLIGRLGSDPSLLVDVLFALLKPDADEAGVTDESFGRAFSGDVLLCARDTLLEELTLFFPDPRVRAMLAEVRRQGEKLADLVAAGSMTTLENLDIGATAGEILTTMRAGLKLREANESNPKSGSTPESSESIPDHSVSAN